MFVIAYALACTGGINRPHQGEAHIQGEGVVTLYGNGTRRKYRWKGGGLSIGVGDAGYRDTKQFPRASIGDMQLIDLQ